MVKFMKRATCLVMAVLLVAPMVTNGVALAGTTIKKRSTARMYALNNILGYDECSTTTVEGSSSTSYAGGKMSSMTSGEKIENATSWEERLYNMIVDLGVEGVSDKPEVIIGIIANAMRESTMNPFSFSTSGGDKFWGLWQFSQKYHPDISDEMIRPIEELAGTSSYWASSTGVPDDIKEQAMEVELQYLVKHWSSFIDNLDAPTNKSGVDGAVGYAELFQAMVENNFTSKNDNSTSFSDDGVKAIAGHSNYTSMGTTRQNATSLWNSMGASTGSSSGASSGSSSSSSGGSALQNAVRQYYQTAMEAQKQYGVPWEMVFAQMQKESQVGTDPKSIANHGATNNYLGITGEGDAGSITLGSHTWAIYSSVEASIMAWAGKKVLRNGRYDAAFKYLDPNNYNLEKFVEEVIKVYAPSSDGNNPAEYAKTVMSLINGQIAQVRKELGLPSSEELAKQEGIDASSMVVSSGGDSEVSSYTTQKATYEICGDLADGTTISGGSARNDSSDGVDGSDIDSGGAGDTIAQIAVAMAWPYEDGTCDSNGKNVVWTDKNSCNDTPKPLYREVMENVLHNSYYKACNWFVLAVMARAGTDPNFPKSGTAKDLNGYMKGSSSWTQINHGGSISNLRPGDIISSSGHIMIYTGDYGYGDTVIASANKDKEVGNSRKPYSSVLSGYEVYRYNP